MIEPDKKTKRKNIITALVIIAFMIFLFLFTLYNTGVFNRALLKTPVLYRVNKNKNIIKAIITNAVMIFFLLVFLSGSIIQFYLLKIIQILKINIRLSIQI